MAIDDYHELLYQADHSWYTGVPGRHRPKYSSLHAGVFGEHAVVCKDCGFRTIFCGSVSDAWDVWFETLDFLGDECPAR